MTTTAKAKNICSNFVVEIDGCIGLLNTYLLKGFAF